MTTAKVQSDSHQDVTEFECLPSQRNGEGNE